MYHHTGRVLSAAALATAAATVVGVTSASAAPSPAAAGTAGTSTRMAAAYGGYPLHVQTLTTDVLGPLQIAVGAHKEVYVADNFAGVLKRIGVKKPLFTAPKGYEVAGVDVSGDGTIAFTWGSPEKHVSYLTVMRHGKKVFTADTGRFERKYNPDKNVTYGVVTKASKACLAEVAKVTGGPATYKGIVDTHAYSVTSVRGGWVVGDAAGNDLLKVNRWGKVSLLKVLPPQPVKISASVAAGLGAPDCKGITYNFEPVPTDVEQGRDGRLYLTTLPGGPEGPSPLGPRGSVYRLKLNGHGLTRLATGFASATNLALTPSCRVLVAELGAGRISTIAHGRPAPVINLPGVASVEFANHAIYAGATGPIGPNGPSGKGKVVKISVRW